MSKKLILGVLGTLFKMSEVEVAELLKTDDPEKLDETKALELIISKDKERIDTIKNDQKKKFDDGYKKGQSESLSKLEKQLRDKYSIEDDLQGEELVEAILAAKTVELQKQSGKKDYTEDEIKKLPVFIKLEKDLRKAVDDAKTEGESKLKQVQDEYTQKELFGNIKGLALTHFRKKNPILSEDAAKAENQINFGLINHLQGYKYQKEGKDYIILKPDGNRLEDAHGHPMTLEQLVDSVATTNFDFKAADDRSSAGNGGAGGSQGGGGTAGKKYSGKAPASAKEYADTLLDSTLDLETKADFKAQYSKEFGSE
jgi:hypothetical protein